MEPTEISPAISSTLSTESETDEFKTYQTKTPKKSKIITPSTASALDRANISGTSVTLILGAVAVDLGFSPKDVVISRSSVRRTRIKCRMEAAKKIKLNFFADCPLTLHWDGKLLPDITGHEKVDRLPVIGFGCGNSQLLGVPCLNSGSGENQAKAVHSLICEWNLQDRRFVV